MHIVHVRLTEESRDNPSDERAFFGAFRGAAFFFAVFFKAAERGAAFLAAVFRFPPRAGAAAFFLLAIGRQYRRRASSSASRSGPAGERRRLTGRDPTSRTMDSSRPAATDPAGSVA